jgi:hypothetical protein
MTAKEQGREGGTSFPSKPDTQTKTARPTSVGPHHRTRDQEDPGNPGIRPEEGYRAEIARNAEATTGQPAGKAAVVAPTPKAGRVSEGPEAAEEPEDPGRAPPVAPTPPHASTADESGAPRDAPPLRGTAKE